MSYTRCFIPLACEAKGYDFKGRQPVGRCVLEGRAGGGKLNVWVQDLKPQTRYGLFLIFESDEKYPGIYMGNLDADSKGKAEMRHSFLVHDLYSFLLDDLVAVAILATDAPGIVSPLCGYNMEAIPWKHGFYEFKEPLRISEEKKTAGTKSPEAYKIKEPTSTSNNEEPPPTEEETPIYNDPPQTEGETPIYNESHPTEEGTLVYNESHPTEEGTPIYNEPPPPEEGTPFYEESPPAGDSTPKDTAPIKDDMKEESVQNTFLNRLPTVEPNVVDSPPSLACVPSGEIARKFRKALKDFETERL